MAEKWIEKAVDEELDERDYEQEIADLKALISRAAPLAWVYRSEEQLEDYADAARRWEKEALELLKREL